MLHVRLFALFILVSTGVAQVPLGASKDDVIAQLGHPRSASRNGDREILNYPDYTILLVAGRVEKLTHKPATSTTPARPPRPASPVPERTPERTLPARVPTPEEVLGPERNRQDNRPQLNTRSAAPAPPVVILARPPVNPPPTRPASQSTMPFDPLAPFRQAIFVALFVFCAGVGLKFWLRSRQRRRDDDLFLDAGRKADAAAVPPLLLPPRLSVPARPDPLTAGWSLELLRSIEWHRFEHLVAAYEREMGNAAELTSFGADGGVDIELFPSGSRTPSRIIQCKAYNQQKVGVDLVRSFYGVMMLRKVPKGSFYTTGSFSDDALRIGREVETLELVDGETFLNRIQRLQLSAQLRLFEVATEGDYTTPTCASCGVKMVLRAGGQGSAGGREFWGCRNYPRCKSVLRGAVA